MSSVAQQSSRQVQTASILFVLTCLSVFWVGTQWADETNAQGVALLWQGRHFALPFLAILVCHELGHFVAARIHGVDASLPYFLPFPLGPIGTMGAVIGMRDPIRERAALLDIGAAGPLAGLVIAIPVLIYGVATSKVMPIQPGEHLREGHSLLYEALLYWLKGPIAPDHDIMLNATAFAGWAGLLVTMMNLVPAGQLDGGHVAYALFGPMQDRFSRRIAQLLIGFGVCMLAYGGWEAQASANLWENVSASGSWLIWAGVISIISRVFGSTHPPTDATGLGRGRRALGWLCLLLFVLLFMPRWLVPGL